ALGATWGVAEAGIAGPQTGRRSRKRAGLAYLAVAGPVAGAREIQTGDDDRSANQRAFATAALTLLDETLRKASDVQDVQ
ncbi:MAG: CinA family protein, partial [Chloroflexota bacterium]